MDFFLGRETAFYDEGIWLEATHKVGAGLHPYVDFPSSYGPLYLFYLGKTVSFLGGRLMDLRIVQGVFQGVVCFLILIFSLEISLSWAMSLGVATLYAYTAANPLSDATMFWAIRYFIGLLFVALMTGEMLQRKSFTPSSRMLIFFLSGPLFYFSGESAVYCFPTYVIWMVYLKRRKNISSIELGKYLLAAFSSALVVALLIGKAIYLYPVELFWFAPGTLKSFGIPYPPLSLETVHYYFPFLILVTSLFQAFKEEKTRWALLASGFALALSLKVSLARSDQIHLSYCYPFVVFSWALLMTSFSKKSLFPKAILSLSLLWALLSFQTYSNLKHYFHQVASLSIHRSAWTRDPAWGIFQKNADMQSLFAVRKEINAVVPKTSSLYIFPLQEILYSFLSRPLFGDANFALCVLRQDAPECFRTFNFTNPEYVLWIPENTPLSWAFDGYYSGFLYTEAFESLHENFELILTSPETGWKLFKRKNTSSPEVNYISPQFSQWKACDPQTSTTPWLDEQNRNLRLEPLSKMTCLRPDALEIEHMVGSFGLTVAKGENFPTDKLRWFCKNLGREDASCSRIKTAHWAWDGFLDPTPETLSRISVFMAK